MVNSRQAALIGKDIKSVTENKRLFSAILIVPIFMAVVLPSVFVLMIGLSGDDSTELQELLTMFTYEVFEGDNLQITLIGMIMDNVISMFFMMIPILASTIVAASSFVGEKEKRTLETLLYSPMSLKQIFAAKIIAAFLLSQIVSIISFLAMMLFVQLEAWLFTGSLILPGPNWIVVLLLMSPALSVFAISLIVRGSAKAKSVEESQQRSVFLIIPLMVLVIGQFSGLVNVNIWLLLGISLVGALLGLLLMRKSSAGFHYERILQ